MGRHAMARSATSAIITMPASAPPPAHELVLGFISLPVWLLFNFLVATSLVGGFLFWGYNKLKTNQDLTDAYNRGVEAQRLRAEEDQHIRKPLFATPLASVSLKK